MNQTKNDSPKSWTVFAELPLQFLLYSPFFLIDAAWRKHDQPYGYQGKLNWGDAILIPSMNSKV